MVILHVAKITQNTRPLKKISFLYLVREVSEGNVYIPVKKKIMRVRDSCLAIMFEINRFLSIFMSLLFQIMF